MILLKSGFRDALTLEKTFEFSESCMVGETVSFCSGCGAATNSGANFCSSCGQKLATSTLVGQFGTISLRSKGYICLGAFILFFSSIGLQRFLENQNGLSRPTEVYQPPANPGSLPPGHPGGGGAEEVAEIPESDEVKALRTAMEADPDNLEKMRAFASAVGDYLRVSPQASPRLALDAVDVLSRILQKVPEDGEALVMMADVSFDQKAFTKAQDFYQRYLKIKPSDNGARARYASTLTFLGKFDDSITELDSIIKADPKNFPAIAYLAITYAQKGDIPRAKAVAASALDVAPSQEAKARFSSFVASLDTTLDTGEQNPRGNVAPLGASGLQGPEAEVVKAIQNNPIAGQKFVRAEVKDKSTLLLYFKDFPMQAMPPFAKEKFFSGIKEKSQNAAKVGINKIAFLDAETGNEMESIEIAN